MFNPDKTSPTLRIITDQDIDRAEFITNQRIAIYGHIDGTPIRPDYASPTTRVRAMLIPVIEQLVMQRVQEVVEVLDAA